MKKSNRFIIIWVCLAFMILVCQSFSFAYADPIGPTPRSDVRNWVGYFLVVFFSEIAAWIVGAELLVRLLTKLAKQKETGLSRVSIYSVYLISMLISLLIGLVLWNWLS